MCSLFFGTLAEGKFCIFGFFMVKLCILRHCRSISSDSGWSKRLKNTMKTTLLPPFAPAGSTSGRMKSLEGQISSKFGNYTCFGYSNIQGFPNELSCAQFGCREVPQNQAERRSTHYSFKRATHIDFWLNFQLPAQNFSQLGPVFLVDEIFGLFMM